MEILKRILALLFATVLLLSCVVAFVGCDEKDPVVPSDETTLTSEEEETEPPLTYEFYEEALYNFFVEAMGTTSNFNFDSCEMKTIEFWYPVWSNGVHIVRVCFFDGQIVEFGEENQLPLIIHKFPLTRDESESFSADWPQEAVSILERQCATGATYKKISIDLAKLGNEDKTKLLKMIYDAYLEEHVETPTYSFEFYEEALLQFYKAKNPEDDVDSLILKWVSILCDKHYYTDIVGCRVSLDYRLSHDIDGRSYMLNITDFPVAKEEFESFAYSWPQDAADYAPNAATPRIHIEYAKLDNTTKAKLLKIVFDTYVEQNPDALKTLSIEPY